MNESDKYPNNSYRLKSKEEQKTKPKADPIAKPIIRKKAFGRRVKDSVIEGSFDAVWEYVFFDVIIPTVQNLLVDTFNESIRGLVYGSSRRASPPAVTSGKTNYKSFYSGVKDSTVEGRTVVRTPTKKFDFDQFAFPTREEAEEILTNLMLAIEEYGSVTVADLMDRLELNNRPYTDNNWGWTDLTQAKTVHVREGWIIDFPEPKAL